MRGIPLALALLVSGVATAQPPALAEVHRMLPADEFFRYALQARGDVDGDGRDDLVIVGYLEPSRVWLQTPDGRFEALPGAFSTDPEFPTATALVDVDADSDLDCVVACNAQTLSCTGPPHGHSGADMLFLNDGSGRFTHSPAALPASPEVRSTCIASGDVDGDGDVDLVLGASSHVCQTGGWPPYPTALGDNWLWLNQGNGTFAAATGWLPGHLDDTYTLALADFDGDGRLDLFAGNGWHQSGSRADRLYWNTGSGFLDVSALLPGPDRETGFCRAHDFDLDGDVDLLVLQHNAARLLRNDGGGVLTPLPAPASTSGVQYGAAFGDYNGDGLLDYCFHDFTARPVLNLGGGAFAFAPALERDIGARRMAFADLESDGDLDLVGMPYDGIEGGVYRNDGSGALEEVTRDIDRAHGRPTAVADFDGDGDLDAVIAAGGASQPGLFLRNDGAGRLSSQPAGDFTSYGTLTKDLAAGDLDNDGRVDVVTVPFSANAGGCSVFWNTGSGFVRTQLGAQYGNCVALGHINGDGLLDAYVGTSSHDFALRNLGNRTFALHQGTIVALTEDVTLADLDNDGDLDAALATALSTNVDRVLRNNGGFQFSSHIALSPSPSGVWSQAVAAFDIDGDLDDDLMFGSSGTPGDRIYRNTPQGLVHDPAALPPGTFSSSQLHPLDADGDGDLDLVQLYGLFSGLPYVIRLLENDGQGTFTVVPGGVPTAPRTNVGGAGDFDGDGDVDLLSVGSYDARVFWNLHRQLAWRTLPRVGRPLVLDLFGRAGEPFALGAALAPAALPIPPLGTLRLDPATLQLAAVGLLDGGGRSAFQAAVPNLPVLAGVDVHWQMLSGVPARFGNREVTGLRFR